MGNVPPPPVTGFQPPIRNMDPFLHITRLHLSCIFSSTPFTYGELITHDRPGEYSLKYENAHISARKPHIDSPHSPLTTSPIPRTGSQPATRPGPLEGRSSTRISVVYSNALSSEIVIQYLLATLFPNLSESEPLLLSAPISFVLP